jgi:hypothetical protein
MTDESVIKTPYGICRIKRLKGTAGIREAAAHNLREIDTPNADNHAPDLRGGIEVLDGPSTSAEILAAEKALHRKHGVAKPRKDAVRGIEMLLSASPHWFDTATDDDKRAWVQAARRFAHDQFPVKGSVLSTIVHDDESSLHLQVIGVPLHQKARKKGGRPPKDAEKRKRWERQQAAPAALSVGLDARTLFGSKPRLRRLQDDYAAAMAPLGLARGRPKSLTGTKHRHHDAWKADRMAEADAKLAEAKKIEQRSEWASQAIVYAQDAIIAGDLVHSEKHKDVLPTKKAADRDRAKGKDPHAPVQRLRRNAGKLWGTVIAFGKRWGELRAREKTADKREAALDEREAALTEREGIAEWTEKEADKVGQANLATGRKLEEQRQSMKTFAVAALRFSDIVRPKSQKARDLGATIKEEAPRWASDHHPPPAYQRALREAEEAEKAALARAADRGSR